MSVAWALSAVTQLPRLRPPRMKSPKVRVRRQASTPRPRQIPM